jgi:hypothetical protein
LTEAATAIAGLPELPPTPLERLHHPGAVRARCQAVLAAVAADRSSLWRLERSRLDAAAERVARLTRERYPDLRIPYHSRWRHFEAGGVDRKAELDALLAGRGPAETARARIDLTVVSVLLDAGAGAQWRYVESIDGRELTHRRSEGLGVASFRAFTAGRFSDRADDTCRADAIALAGLSAGTLREIFQVSAENPMVGLEGRAALIARLGHTMLARPAGTLARPGALFDLLSANGTRTTVSATEVLAAVLRLTTPAWASGSVVMGQPAGDMWPHRFAGGRMADGSDDAVSAGIVPFHKLSQWLTYSLLEPLQWSGLQVSGLDQLTGLPEYRNGGLLIDCGVLVPRDTRLMQRRWKPADEFIVEWRALTVALLDELAERVRALLGQSAEQMPLACVLEGGTWAAGREIAAELRGGSPPLLIDSDGTIF